MATVRGRGVEAKAAVGCFDMLEAPLCDLTAKRWRRKIAIKNLLVVTTLVAAFAFGTFAQGAEPKVKVLSTPEDATQKTVLLGRNFTGSMIVTCQLEPAKSVWMQMDNPPKWRQRHVRKGEIYHLDVMPIDPSSKAVISYADVKFKGVNRTNGKKVSVTLDPMWDNSGLHYAANNPLAGDGVYELVISVGMPTFGRVPQYKDLWLKAITTKFHFKLVSGKVMEVSEPEEEAQKKAELRAEPQRW